MDTYYYGVHIDPNRCLYEANFDLIQQDEIIVNGNGYDCDLISDLVLDNHHLPQEEDVFDFNHALPGTSLFVDVNVDEDSSATTTPTPTSGKADRSRTLISERRRRGRMKEKLYQLRSLVPNITKMDKASIIGDAVLYVQDLQTQAKKLRSGIASLEAALSGSIPIDKNKKSNRIPQALNPICKKIIQINMVQVEENGAHLKIVSNKGKGVAASLYRAIESLTNFFVQNSNMVTTTETFTLTFTLTGRECETMWPNLKMWVMAALLNQGFELSAYLCD